MRSDTTRGLSSVARLLPLIAILVVVAVPNGAAQVVLPDTVRRNLPDYLFLGEAPTALLQSKVGDADVDLYAAGSWQTTISASLAIGIHPDLGNGSGYQFPYAFPGMDPFSFLNQVDLTISLWILNRYFFQTTFLDQFALNTFLLGYQGQKGEFVQKVLIGNTLMPFSQYPFLSVDGTEYPTDQTQLGASSSGGVSTSGTGATNAGEAGTQTSMAGGDIPPFNPPASAGITPNSNTSSGGSAAYSSSGTNVTNSLGIAALFETDRSRHELVFRYEDNALAHKSYLGTNEVVRTHINPADYTSGRFFVLPDANITNLQVYLEDPAGKVPATSLGGASGMFRKADLDQIAVYDLQAGTLFLREKPVGRVLVTYTKAGFTVGNASLGQNAAYALDSNGAPDSGKPVDFSWSPPGTSPNFNDDIMVPSRGSGHTVDDIHYTIGSTDYLLLWQPGYYSPFELQNQYDATDAVNSANSAVGTIAATRALIARRGTSSAYALSPARSAVVITDDNRVAVVDAADSNVRDFANRYPFAPDPTTPNFPDLYGVHPNVTPSYTPFDVMIEQQITRTAITIDSDAIPGSVHVTINGKETTSFSVDFTSGTVSFPFPILPTDNIDITYRTRSAGTTGGQIVFGSGNTILLSKRLILDLALGLRWSVLTGGYTTEPGQSPGSLVTSARLSYTGTRFTGSIAAGVSVTSPDTTGILRLAGMGEDTSIFAVDATRLLPSAAPTELGAFSEANRGETYYKDYGAKDPLGGTSLQPYNWSNIPSSQQYPYASGSRIGPYAATGGTDGPDGQVMVLDYHLGNSQWVGGDLAAPSSQELDLSAARAISVTWRLTAPVSGTVSGAVRVFLQAGSLGEDRDGNGQLDSGNSAVNPGFDFHDSAHSNIVLRAGGPPWTPFVHTEDTNGNGILDAEDVQTVASFPLDGGTPQTSPTGFVRTEIPLTAADRARLRDVRGVRIVVYDTAGGSDGRVVVGGITIEGTSFSGAINPASTTKSLNLRETDESVLAPAKTLLNAFPETSPMLAGSAANQVLLVSWGTPTPFVNTDTWSAVHYTTPVLDSQYSELVFYVAPAALSVGPESLTVHYDYDDTTPGLTATFTLPAVDTPPRWHKIDISLAARTLSIDGAVDPAATVSFSPSGNSLTRLQFDGTGTTAGVLAIDEIALTNAATRWGAGTQVQATYSAPGVILHSGDVSILKDARISASGYARTSGFATMAQETNPQNAGLALNGGADILIAHLDANFSVDGSWTDANVPGSRSDLVTAGGHALRLPAGPSPVTFTDAFQRSYSPAQPQLYRKNSLSVAIPQTLSVVLMTQGSYPGQLSATDLATTSAAGATLSQTWTTTVSSAWPGPFSLQLGVNFSDVSSFDLADNSAYPVAWIDAYRFALPWNADPSATRTGGMTLDLGLKLAGVSPSLSIAASYQTAYGSSGSSGVTQANQQLSTASVTLSVPIALVPAADGPPQSGLLSGLTITPSYQRLVKAAGVPVRSWLSVMGTDASSAGSVMDFRLYGSDIAYYGRSISDQSYLFAAAPFYDLFSQPLAATFASESTGYAYALYEPGTSLQISRSIGSNWADLIVPNRVQVSVSRDLTRQADSVTDGNSVDIGLTYAAINLFGRLGAYPLFRFYRSEEITSSIDLKLQTATTQTGLYWSLYHLLSTTVRVTEEDSLSLDNQFTVSAQPETAYSDTGTAAFNWRTHPTAIFGIKKISDALASGAYVAHREAASIVWNQTPTVLGLTQSGLTLTLEHDSGLHIPKMGEVSVFGKFGFGLTPYSTSPSDGQIVSVGLQIGIKGQLQF
ncbi:MAG TPA: hypothetical protein VMW87_08370 [Spirochaetia bacterium]|nr:hypothetical protein [Spirochaetia bacterium]